jgi:hypothetical protein
MDEEFSSAVRPDGRFGVVFEADGETSYFYLLDMAAPEGQQIISAFKTPDRPPGEPNAEVQWSHDGAVAAAIRGGKILAVMDLRTPVRNLRHVGRAPGEGDALLFGHAG